MQESLKFLFVVNNKSGSNETDWSMVIDNYFDASSHSIRQFLLPDDCCSGDIVKEINATHPDRVIAVGGDGTVKLVAEACMSCDVPVGILPAGSANGLAKELMIPVDPVKALDAAVSGKERSIHLTRVNGKPCIHLSDIGFNAFVIRKFETFEQRGLLGYFRAAWSVLRSHSRLKVTLKVDDKTIEREAVMIVIANATKYGTGALINPNGSLEDKMFEVVVVKKIAIKELYKMMFSHQPFDKAKIEVFQTDTVQINAKKAAHFQIDGEYMGKTQSVEAIIMPNALKIVVPNPIKEKR